MIRALAFRSRGCPPPCPKTFSRRRRKPAGNAAIPSIKISVELHSNPPSWPEIGTSPPVARNLLQKTERWEKTGLPDADFSAFAGMHGPPPRRVLLFLGYDLQARRLIHTAATIAAMPQTRQRESRAAPGKAHSVAAKPECPEISALRPAAGTDGYPSLWPGRRPARRISSSMPSQ